MTFFLIVLAIFLALWAIDSYKRKEKAIKHRIDTVTNVPLQDELFKENFSMVIHDLEEMDKKNFISEEKLYNAIVSLYNIYDIPDLRDETKKAQDLFKLKKEIEHAKDIVYSHSIDKAYPDDSSGLTIAQRIWLDIDPIPHADNPDLIFGVPGTEQKIERSWYVYSNDGTASHIFDKIMPRLIYDITILLTKRDLKVNGCNYSYDRQESLAQQCDAKIAKYDKNKKKYPWLYD